MSRKNEKLKFSKLRLRQNKSNATCSPQINEKISSYFPKISQEKNSQVETIAAEESCEEKINEKVASKYSIESALDSSASDFTCFKSPRIRPKRQTKIFSYDSTRITKHKPKGNTVNKVLVTESNGACAASDVNMEHLQLALALSESLQNTEGPAASQSDDAILSTQQKTEALRKTLQKYGFKSDLKVTRSTLAKPAPIKRKKMRCFKTVLMTRTEEDRRNIIEDKVSQVLANVSQYNEYVSKCYPTVRRDDSGGLKPGSFMLRELYDPDATLFRKCALDILQDAAYYNSLVDAEDAVRTGSLLRDWHRIPGRERTPSPTPRSSTVGNGTPTANSSTLNRSISPDLFSDDEIIPSYRSNVVKVASAVQHLDKALHEEVCLDLTQSSGSYRSIASPAQLIPAGDIDLTLSSDESRSGIGDDASLDISKAISMINMSKFDSNTLEGDKLNLTQLLNFKDLEAVADLTQSSKQSDLASQKSVAANDTGELFDEQEQFITNDCKIEHLIRKAMLSNSQTSNSDSRQLSVIENCDVTDIGDLICDAVLTGASENPEQEHPDAFKDELETSRCTYVSNKVIEMDVTCISSDSGDESAAEGFNYSSHHSFSMTQNNDQCVGPLSSGEIFNSSQDNNSNDDTGSDDRKENNVETETSFKVIDKPHRSSITELCVPHRNISSRYSNKRLFNDSLEKILEENDPWSTDVIEINATVPAENVYDCRTDPEKSIAQMNVTCISSDSEDDGDLVDKELNYSSNRSFLRKCNSTERTSPLSSPRNNSQEDNETDDHKSDRPETASRRHTNKLQHSRITQLNISHQHSDKKMFNDSLEKILEVNDPWSSDVIEMNASVSADDVCTPRKDPAVVRAFSTPQETGSPDYIIKTSNVTPMPSYQEMDTPQRNQELDKFGIKPLKRAKSIKILEYIYNATHPVVSVEKTHESCSSEENDRVIKRRKPNKKEKYISNSQVRKRRSQLPMQSAPGEIPIVAGQTANEPEEDMVFERKQSRKAASCRIPFHIVWHNFVSSQPRLQEEVLLYEPLQLEQIDLQLKNLGFKFHVQDIITFFDKKCITIRTTQNNRSNKCVTSQK